MIDRKKPIGTMTVSDALARLLGKTGLEADRVNDKTIVLRRAEGNDEAAPVEKEVDPPPGTAETSLPTDSEEWVELTNYANLRSAPSTTAETLRVAEKGSKLRVTGRKGSWVQVKDPATAAVGWVYGRYIQTAQAPQR